MGHCAYIMPGFSLAEKAAEIYEANTAGMALFFTAPGFFTSATARQGSL